MAQYVALYDSVNGTLKSSGKTVTELSGIPNRYDYLLVSDMTVVSTPEIDFTGRFAEVYVNGVGPLKSGAGEDYVITLSPSYVTFSYAIEAGSRVTIFVV